MKLKHQHVDNIPFSVIPYMNELEGSKNVMSLYALYTSILKHQNVDNIPYSCCGGKVLSWLGIRRKLQQSCIQSWYVARPYKFMS